MYCQPLLDEVTDCSYTKKHLEEEKMKKSLEEQNSNQENQNFKVMRALYIQERVLLMKHTLVLATPYISLQLNTFTPGSCPGCGATSEKTLHYQKPFQNHFQFLIRLLLYAFLLYYHFKDVLNNSQQQCL